MNLLEQRGKDLAHIRQLQSELLEAHEQIEGATVQHAQAEAELAAAREENRQLKAALEKYEGDRELS